VRPGSAAAAAAAWPELTLTEWDETRLALHMWSQVVGKVCLALEPLVNHWWNVALHITARGMATPLMPANGDALQIEFDFVDSVLALRMASGEQRRIALESQSVAAFHAAVMAALDDLGVQVRMLPRPVEVPVSIPFPEDTRVRDYDAAAARRFWLALVQSRRVMQAFRAEFVGKVSPVHFFWGGFDLAVTRFSGREAPPHPGGVPNCADWVQHIAYSHEVSSCGYWPGGSEEGSFYAYAYPSPPGYEDWPAQPGDAFWDKGFREFMLPYRAVRTAADPDATLLSFLQSTYEGAAELLGWDRAALEARHANDRQGNPT
jgi:hypothetical protein